MSGLAKALPSVTIEFRHPRATREARLGEALVAYEFRRAKRRSIGFSVRPEGLTVRAPQWVPLYQVDAALREKADWILRKLTESRARAVLTSLGLLLEASIGAAELNPRAASGQAMMQTPAAGTRLPRGGRVHVIFAAAKE